MRLAAHDGVGVNTEPLQIVHDEVAKDVIAYLAQHFDRTPQSAETRSRVRGATTRPEEKPVRQTELARRRERSNGTGEYVGDKNSETDDIHGHLTFTRLVSTP